MSRTLRSKRLRALLWYTADGKCQRCGGPLGDDWQADHIEPWVMTHRTNVHEMQALCADCNRKKGTMSYRQHQRETDRVCQDILKGRAITRIVLSVTPGGGKSLIPQIIAHRLIPTVIDKICWVVPRLSLQHQAATNFVSADDRALVGHRLEIREATNDTDPSRGVAGFVTTYHALAINPGYYRDEFRRYRYGFILDEPHHLFLDDPWHRAIDPLVQLSAFQVFMSGTWERERQIAYIDYRKLADGTLTPDIPNTFTIQDAVAYIRYTRTMAIQEHAIKPLRLRPVDGWTEYVDRSGQMRFVPSLADSGKESGDALFTALRTEYAYALLAQMMIDYLGFRLHRPWAKALIIAPSISLAREYLKYIRTSYPDIRADIAVSKDEEEKQNSQQAKDSIKRFKKPSSDPSAIDALVTVAMAYEGLDVPPITHLAFATHIRSRSWVEQALARAARVFMRAAYEEQFGYVYGPDDPAFNEVTKRIIAEQEEAIREPETPTDGGKDRAPGPDDPPVVIPMRGEATRDRAVDMIDGDALTYEETAQLVDIITRNGVRGIIDPIMLHRMANEARQPESPQTATMTHPSLTIREREDKYRKSIESYARQVDNRQAWEFGTCNGILRRKFRKPREEMTEAELIEVWTWLTRQYSV